MAGKRERLARLLDRSGAVDAILRARARVGAQVLTVLTYHGIGDVPPGYSFDPEVLDASPEQFAGQLDLLARHFTVIGIDEVLGALAGARLPPNPVLITFDDGYRSCKDVALPMLAERGAKAVFFITTQYVSERRLPWWDRIHYLIHHTTRAQWSLETPRRFLVDLEDRAGAVRMLLGFVKNEPGLDLEAFLASATAASGVAWSDAIEHEAADRLIMTWDDVRALRDAGMDVQSHTRRHRVLQTLGAEDLGDELAGSRAELERELCAPVRAIAYPVGRSIARIPAIRNAIIAAGYEVGFSNASGVNVLGRGPGRAPGRTPGRGPGRTIDPLDVRRIAMDPSCPAELFRSQLAIPRLAYRSPRHTP
jgi:peptidoglycan/xylan/chitin deacetylase (PgdA/CDA1 family)